MEGEIGESGSPLRTPASAIRLMNDVTSDLGWAFICASKPDPCWLEITLLPVSPGSARLPAIWQTGGVEGWRWGWVGAGGGGLYLWFVLFRAQLWMQEVINCLGRCHGSQSWLGNGDSEALKIETLEDGGERSEPLHPPLLHFGSPRLVGTHSGIF